MIFCTSLGQVVSHTLSVCVLLSIISTSCNISRIDKPSKHYNRASPKCKYLHYLSDYLSTIAKFLTYLFSVWVGILGIHNKFTSNKSRISTSKVQ
uniref:Uncharacterized protein n=1 Tax=Theileria annulata TaxID=5874 RepID=A0A3B0N4R3_THEAN